ncbi:MAG: carboxypeptidase regulatory-like domain-containing protein [Bacteroidales bacterium]|nr:carboxypeptidase regulatory-like domain-containing protein [Bacteroidales bacterium]
MKRIIISSLVPTLLIAFLPLNAQSISGVVRDALSGEPLAGAIVRLTGDEMNTQSFIMTDREGHFEIWPYGKASYLVVSLLGYEEKTFPSPFSAAYHIDLSPSSETIQESVVKANKVVMAGDTTKYNVMALKTRDDLVLGDVLKRIPGVEMTSSGHIKIDGRDLGKFYVDGKDILSGNYNLATKNLTVDAVKSLEVIRGHQSIKLLQGIKESEDAAINILLSDAAKGKINWKGKVGAGYAVEQDHFPLSGEISAFWVSGAASSIDVAEYDSQGNAMADITSSTIGIEDKQHSLDSRLSISPVSAPLDDKRSLFNHTLGLRSVNTYSPKESSTLGFTTKYSNSLQTSSSSQSKTYLNEGEGRTISTTEDRSQKEESFKGNLTYVNNSSNIYITEKMFVEIGRGHGETSTTGDLSRSLSGNSRSWDIGNRIGVQFRAGKSNALGIISYTQLSGFKESLDIIGEEPFQKIQSSGLFQDISLIGLTRSRNRISFSVRPSVSYTLYKRDSDLSGLSEEGVEGAFSDSSASTYLSTGLSWELSYDKGLFHFGTDGKLHHDFAKFRSYKEGKLLLDASLYARYTSGRWEGKISAGMGTVTPDIQTLGNALLLTDYNTLHKGQESLYFLPSKNVGASFLYRNPVRGWNLRITSDFSATESLLSGRDILGNYILTYLGATSVPQNMLNQSVELTKGIYSINGNIRMRLSDIRTSTLFRQSGKTYEISSDILSPSFEINTLPTSFWRLYATGNMSFSKIKASGITDTGNTSLTVKMTNTFYLSDKLSIGTQHDFYRNSATDKNILFNDVFATWTRNRFRIKVMINNISNLKEYSTFSISPLLESASSYKIRPLTFMIGLDWSL